MGSTELESPPGLSLQCGSFTNLIWRASAVSWIGQFLGGRSPQGSTACSHWEGHVAWSLLCRRCQRPAFNSYPTMSYLPCGIPTAWTHKPAARHFERLALRRRSVLHRDNWRYGIGFGYTRSPPGSVPTYMASRSGKSQTNLDS